MPLVLTTSFAGSKADAVVGHKSANCFDKIYGGMLIRQGAIGFLQPYIFVDSALCLRHLCPLLSSCFASFCPLTQYISPCIVA